MISPTGDWTVKMRWSPPLRTSQSAPPIFIESLIGRDSPQDFSAGIQPVITASAGDNLAAKNLQ